MRKFMLRAVETTVYSREFELDELEEFLDQTLDGDFEGDVEAFTSALYEEASKSADVWFVTDLERHGDVQGQEWIGDVRTLPIGGRDPDGE